MNTLSIQLAQLEQAQLVRVLAEEELAYLIKHAMTQETAYDSLLVKKRRAIHQHVAEAYEQLYAGHLAEHAAEFAYHYAQAGDDAKTVEYALQAADAAMRVFAYLEARGHIQLALDAFTRLPDTPDYRRQRVDAIDAYVVVAWGSFVPQELFALVNEAEELARSLPNPDGTLGDGPRLARIYLRLTGLHFARSEYPQAIYYARRVLDDANLRADKALMGAPSSQIGLALIGQGRFTEAAPYLAQAVTLLDAERDRWEWYAALSCLGITLVMRGQIADGLAEAKRALTETQAAKNYFGITQCLTILLPIYMEMGDMPQLLAASEQTIAAALKSDMPMFQSLGLGFQALATSRMGGHARAQEMMAAAHTAAARVGGQFIMSDWLEAVNMEILYNAGKPDQVIALAEQVIADAQSFGGILAEAWARRVLGQALAAGVPAQWEHAESEFASSVELLQTGGAMLEAAQTHRAWGHALEAWGRSEAAREHFEKAAVQRVPED